MIGRILRRASFSELMRRVLPPARVWGMLDAALMVAASLSSPHPGLKIVVLHLWRLFLTLKILLTLSQPRSHPQIYCSLPLSYQRLSPMLIAAHL